MVWSNLKAALAVMSGIALVSTVALAFAIASNTRLAKQLEKLEDQAKANQVGALADLREKCASQAHLRFLQLGFTDQGGGSSFAIYSNHYNKALSRCFMTLQTTTFVDGSMEEDYFLFDAYEQRTYAESNRLTSKEAGPLPTLVVCRLVPSSMNERRCANMSEFEKFVVGYMEQ